MSQKFRTKHDNVLRDGSHVMMGHHDHQDAIISEKLKRLTKTKLLLVSLIHARDSLVLL